MFKKKNKKNFFYFEIQIEYSQDGKIIDTITRDAGYIPIMVKVDYLNNISLKRIYYM